MNYETWYPLLDAIRADIKVSWDSDEKAAQILSSLLDDSSHLISFSYLEELLINSKVIVFGAGPSLERGIHRYNDLFKDCILIAADGATTALINNNIVPHIIVTDLDGNIADQLHANKMGSIIVVHAHGDNIEVVEKIIPRIEGAVIGSIQIDPRGVSHVFNVGGFTDGDRAVYLAAHCYAKRISLIGFDFEGSIGKYCLPEKKDRDLKLMKLRWCLILIKRLQQDTLIQFLKG
ncbi:MAG: DUF115 domain-containing protein [Candidatus Thermoplasmatota archaeon]|nr:DUF115 domain-containing protein [Candidatus Thermoplasmatota archaeon]